MAWILAAIAVMAVAGLLIVTSNPKPERQQEHRQASPTEDNGKAQPLAAKDAKQDAEAGAKDHEQEGGSKGFRQSLRWFVDVVEARDKFFTAFGTLVIAGFTVGLAIATIALFFATRDLVKGADDTAERQLRAYIGLQGAETAVYPLEKGAFAFIAHAELRNYGQTPAYDLTVKSNVKIDIPENIPFDDFPGIERGVPSMAFKDASFHVRVGWPISEEDKIALYERRKVFFFWGSVEYRDAFDKLHRFRFHLMSSEIATGTGGTYNMNPHGPGFEGD